MSAGIEYANEAYVWIGQTQITTKLEGEVSLINCSSLVLYYLFIAISFSTFELVFQGISTLLILLSTILPQTLWTVG